MSYIQLVSDEANSSQFSVNFGDVINIAPNSKVGLIDASITKSLQYDFGHLTSLQWTIDWGNLTHQGGLEINYTLLTSAFTNKNKVSHKELCEKVANVINNTAAYKNYNITLNGELQTNGQMITVAKIIWNTLNKPKGWDAGNFEGWNDDDLTSAELIAREGDDEPSGNFLNYALMDAPLSVAGEIHGGAGAGSFEAEGKDRHSAVIGLSFDDDTTFTDGFFSKQGAGTTESEFWDFRDVEFRDYVAGINYQFKEGADLDNYTVINVSTGATVFTSAVVSGISDGGCEIELTNAANPGGIPCKFERGKGEILYGGLAMATSGTGYVVSANPVALDGGHGAGATIYIDSIGAGGSVGNFRVADGGAGYESGDVLMVQGGTTQAVININQYVNDYAVDCTNILPTGFQMFWGGSGSTGADRGPPTYIPSLVDIPIGVHLTYRGGKIFYFVFVHKTGEDYDPYERTNSEVVDSGSFEDENCEVYFNVGLNQDIYYNIIGGDKAFETDGEVSLETDVIGDYPTKTGGVEYGLRMCYLSDVKGSKVVSMNNFVDRTEPVGLEWTKAVTTDDFDNKEGLEITWSFPSTALPNTLGKYLGFPDGDIELRSGYQGLDDADPSYPIRSGAVDTGGGESKRLNICVDNLTHQSYKNFSNDNIGSGALNGRQGALSGTLDKMVGVFPPFQGVGNTYGRLYHSGVPVYVDLNNKAQIQLNRLDVSFRDSETNKVSNDLIGSSSITIHIKK